MSADVLSTPVLVLGASPTALAVVRELAAEGFRRVYLASDGVGCAGASRHVRGVFRAPDVDALAIALKALQTRYQQPVWLLPTSDDNILRVENLLQSRPVLPVKVFSAYANGLAARFLDKAAFAQLMAEHGDFPQPQTVNGAGDMTSAPPPLPWPFFCKPRFIHELRQQLPGRKGVIVRNQFQWAQWQARFGQESDQWLFQEIIPGAEDNIVLYAGAIAAGGRVLGTLTARKLRQYPPGFGSASLVISESLPDVARRAGEFLRNSGFLGVCCGEFKWCPRRQDWVVIEFNPRPSLWYALAMACGVPLVSRMLKMAILADEPVSADNNGQQSTEPDSEWPRVLWRYGVKDMASAWFYRRHGRGFVLPPPAPDRHGGLSADKKVYAVFSWSDPLPLAVELLTYARKGGQRLISRFLASGPWTS